MSNDLTFGMRLTYDGKAAVAGLEQTRAGVENVNAAASKMASQYSGLNQAVKQHTAAVADTERNVTKLLDRYDPLGAKLRQLQGDFKALDAAASSGKIAGRDDARVDAVYVRLQKEIAAATAATSGFGASSKSAALSAGQLRMATQQLPMQFTDIFTSLAAGQTPMMVLLQQGGQIKDQFGGVGAAAKAMGGYMLGLVNPITGVAAALAAGAYAFHHWENVAVESAEKVMDALEKAIGDGKRLASMNKEALDGAIADAEVSIEAKKALIDALRADTKRRFNWRAAAEEEAKYNAEIERTTSRLIEMKSARDRLGDGADKLREQSSFARREALAKEIALLETDNARQQAGSREYLANLSAIADKKKQLADMDKKGQSDALTRINAEKKAYDKLNESVTGRIAALTAEVSGETRLTESQKKLVELGANYKKGLTAQSEAKQQDYIASLAQAAGLELAAAAQHDAAKVAKEATEAHQASMAALSGEYDALAKKLEADKYALSIIGKTKEEVAQLAAMRGEDALQTKIQEAAQLDATGTDEARLHVLREQIKLMLELRGVATETAAAVAADDAIKQQAKDWKKFSGDIESSLTDALMRGFEAGNSFGENFVKSLENTLKTAALKVVVQAMVSPIMGGIGAMAQGGSFMSGASAAGSLGNIGGLVGGFGSAIGSGAVADFGAGMAGTFVGPALPGSAASIGASVGAAMPYIGAAVLAYSLLKDNGGTPTQSLGHANVGYDAAGNQTSYQSQYGVSNAATDATVAGMQSSYAQTAKSLGIGTVATQFGYAANTGENSQGHNFGLSGGAVGGPQFVQGETAYSDAAMGEAASRAVFAALQGSDLPAYLAGVFDGLDASKMSGQDISNTLAFAGALALVRDGLTSTATPISVAQDALDAIGSTAASFTTDFVAAIDAGMTPERLAQWQAAGAALGNLGDMSLTMSAAVPQLTQTLYEQWNAQVGGVRELSRTYDSSVSATYALSAANRERYATEQQLVDQISGAMSTLPAMFAGTAEQMKLSVMDAQAKSNYFVDQSNALEAQIMSATDPAKIEELARKYNDAANAAWSNLDDTQRQSNLDQYTRNLDEINAVTQEKLGKSLDEIITTSGTDLPALIATAMGNALAAAAAAQQAVANAMQTAADTMQQAADTPVQLDVGVDFTANVPGDSQVSVVQP